MEIFIFFKLYKLKICINNNEKHMFDIFKNTLIEFVGTLVYVYTVEKLGTALAVTVGLGVAAFLFGRFSGGHFNPIVTFMRYIDNTIPLSVMLQSITIQFFAAYVLIKYMH